jgi:osmotically-inducible protein OsmY
MSDVNKTVTDVRAALEFDPRFGLTRFPLDVRSEDNKVVLQGEVSDISEKRLAVECARRVPGVHEIVDKIHVRPHETVDDLSIRNCIGHFLIEERVFFRIAVACQAAGQQTSIVRAPTIPEGAITVMVENGEVRLTGSVPTLSQRVMAGVLAWWAPGCRNVVNDLCVQPLHNRDAEIAEAVDLVLNKNPLLEAGRITVSVREGRVTLRGLVANETEKRMAERDTWYVDDVREVVNALEVYYPPASNAWDNARRPSSE